jgi:P-type Ca2+ transporter type 2C
MREVFEMKQKLGLTSKQAAEKLKEYGKNEIKDVARVSLFTILFRQVRKNFVIYLLFVAAVLSFAVGKGVTGYAILVIITLLITVGFFQEYRAEKAIKALRQMIMPVTIVIRDGKETDTPSSELVPGDVVILRSGEKVPADCLVLEQKELRVDESILTGESAEVKKTASLDANKAEKQNMVFMGTHIVGGKCTAEILHTGMNTEFGKIAGMISSAIKELPLQDKVNKIAKYMVLVALTVSFATGILMVSRNIPISSDNAIEILIVVIALSVSAFPQGFPVVLMSTLAGGAYLMAKENAIVNRLSIIETLGETTVICSDKTGTITTGEMTVQHIYLGNKHYAVTGVGFHGEGKFLDGKKEVEPKGENDLELLLKTVTICNDSLIERTGEDSQYRIIGTPTEGSLLICSAKAGIYTSDYNLRRKYEMPFSSERKMMSVAVKEREGTFVYAKGAPEIIMEKCVSYRENGLNKPLSEEQRSKFESYQEKMAKKRFRVMAVAYKKRAKSLKQRRVLFFWEWFALMIRQGKRSLNP